MITMLPKVTGSIVLTPNNRRADTREIASDNTATR
jgi:hypothetical protein